MTMKQVFIIFYDPETGRFINADDTAYIGYDSSPISTNIFAYCANNPVNRVDYGGNISRKKYFSLKSDWAGRELLWYYLYGNGKTRVKTDEKWAKYMKANATLKGQVRNYIRKNLANLKKGTSIYIRRTTSMEIDNGENIIGYEFLHGTNAKYGGFQIEGRITSNSKGTYTFSFKYTWNDYMNAEEKYTTDQIKAVLGKIISFNRAKNYILRIIWSDTSKLNYRGVWASGWLS